MLIRPLCSTTHVDGDCCYRPSSMVCPAVGLSVSLSVTVVSPAKTAEPIEMPFGLRTWISQRNRLLDGVQIHPWEVAILRGEGTTHCKL